jgi:hypothetical protein
MERQAHRSLVHDRHGVSKAPIYPAKGMDAGRGRD